MRGAPIFLFCLSGVLALAADEIAPWIVADWGGNEPQFPPGSLFWKTNEYRSCPVVYRTIIEIGDTPVESAGFRAEIGDYAYFFVNGQQIDVKTSDDGRKIEAEFGHLLEPGRNTFVVSVGDAGFSLVGGIIHTDGSIEPLSTDPIRWRAQKLAPLTVIEREPFMSSDFDDSEWFGVKKVGDNNLRISEPELSSLCGQIRTERLRKWDDDGRWRLEMLVGKGIAIVDWEAFGWSGAHRLPAMVLDAAREALNTQREPGWLHAVAESLTWYVRLNDEVTNLKNHAVGIEAIRRDSDESAFFADAAAEMESIVNEIAAAISTGRYDKTSEPIEKGKSLLTRVRSERLMNDLCRCLDNKFGWFDSTELLGSDPADWGLIVDPPATVATSPLSPAAFIEVGSSRFTIRGWDDLEPIRVYEKPANVGPIGVWAVLGGSVSMLRPSDDGLVYDRERDGDLEENWIMLISDLASGGHLPVQLVFLNKPDRIIFRAGEKGTSAVTVEFGADDARLFALKPLKEWRGMLRMARVLKSTPFDQNEASSYIDQCRFWSRALLNWQTTFSEIFALDPETDHSLICVDVYNYERFTDDWGTDPILMAPLPPLLTYGLMMNCPGLEVISKTEPRGSRGRWGDNLVALDQGYVIYRVPLDRIKRFGGFTAYCFGPTDIGEPGSKTEVSLIKSTGSNSFRPQHNQTGERAMRTLEWCWEQRMQNVFNTDEKWVPDIVEHFRTLARKCRDYPPDAVAYDPLNEPETRVPEDYNPLIRKITAAIREIDQTHLIYVEAFPPWAPKAKPFPRAAFENLEPTGDELTCYSFHDYEFRLPERWPNREHDARDIMSRWIPAFKFGIDSGQPIHLGEFGAFEQTDQDVYSNKSAITLMMDYLRIFDQFGWHWHYYSNRGTTRVRRDGSLQESLVQEAYRRYFSRGTFNALRSGFEPIFR